MRRKRFLRPTRGFALLLLVVFVLATLGILLLFGLATASRIPQPQRDTRETLARSQSALAGFSMGAIGANARPGNTFAPDVLSESPGNYNGRSPLGCFDVSKPNGLPLIPTGSTMRCLGRLPWRELGIEVRTDTQEDVLGEMPWIAISANLLDTICLGVLNSNTVHQPYTGYACDGTTLPHPWLTVRDAQANVVSNKVAIVLIVPGPPLNRQIRQPVPNLGGASQYLDSVTIGGTNFSNADLDNDFIVGTRSETFNDVVSYITVDEWMAFAEKRVGGELINAIANSANPNSFRTKYNNNRVPWSAPFADPSFAGSYLPTAGTLQGLLPVYSPEIDYPTSLTYKFTSTGGLSFDTQGTTLPQSTLNGFVNSQRLVPSTRGACKWTTAGIADVACNETLVTGLPLGVAKRVIQITITASSSGFTILPATSTSVTTRNINKPTTAAAGFFTVNDYSSAGTLVSTATVSGGSASASVTGMTMPLNVVLPKWIAENRWQEVVYAAVAPDHAPGSSGTCGAACLNVGNRNDVQFAVLTTGPALAGLGQLRPSPTLSNYLDTTENSNGDRIFLGTSIARTPTYNDQIFTFP